MAKSKSKRKSGINTQKIFKFIRIGALILPAVATALGPGTPRQKIVNGVYDYFGYDLGTKKFNLGALARGWGPFAGSLLVTYGIPTIAGMIRSF